MGSQRWVDLRGGARDGPHRWGGEGVGHRGVVGQVVGHRAGLGQRVTP